jgi:hypothetical protein
LASPIFYDLSLPVVPLEDLAEPGWPVLLPVPGLPVWLTPAEPVCSVLPVEVDPLPVANPNNGEVEPDVSERDEAAPSRLIRILF